MTHHCNKDYEKWYQKGIHEGKEMIPPNIWDAFKEGHEKGRQEMRDEIREWILENWACCGCGLCMNDHRAEIEFDAKFGDKK